MLAHELAHLRRRDHWVRFLELFVPATMAHVEIVPPAAVTEADQSTAWRHPYHADATKLVPVAIATLAVLLVLGSMLIWLDIFRPVSLQ